MSKFSIFQTPMLSFYSRDVYRDVATNWTGPAFGYLLLVLAVCWLVTMVGVTGEMNKFFDEQAPKIVDQVPVITIRQGEVSISEPQPYRIKDPESGKLAAIIDTTGSITSLEDSEARLLLLKTTLLYKKDEFQTQEYDLSTVEEFTLTREDIYGWVKAIKALAPTVVFISALIGSYLARILQALVYALLGMAFAAICKVKFSYETLLRLAVVAVTPAMVVKTLVGALDIDLPWSGLIYFLVAMGYLYFAIQANADTPSAGRQGASQ